MIEIEINGQPLCVEQAASIIEVADQHGIYIPRFCYHKKLSIAANCRMCLIEVEKSTKPLPACATPVTAGMRVFTQSAKAKAAQQAVMEFLLINHPLDCPICDQGGECELQDLSLGYGSDISRFSEGKRAVQDENLGALIATEMTRCIQCTRCVRFGTEIAGIKELREINRGENMQISTYIRHSLASELSGNIIDLCPVGALTSKPFRFTARAWELQQSAAIAPHDCVGTNIYVHTRDQRVMRVVPRENEAINEAWLSDRDRYAYTGLNGPDRSTQPMVKINQQWQTTDWNTALHRVVSGLQSVLQAEGPCRLGALASPNLTTEEFYLLQKLMRGLGCHNIDHRLHQTDTRDQARAPLYPPAEISLVELEHCDCIVLVGSNIQREQPLIAHRIRKASLRGAKIFSINCLDYHFNFGLTAKAITTPAQLPAVLAAVAEASAGPVVPAGLSTVEAAAFTETLATQLQQAKKAVMILGAIAYNHPAASRLRYLTHLIATQHSASQLHLSEGANSVGAWLAGVVPHRAAAGVALTEPGLSAYAMFQAQLRAYLLLNIEPDLDCAYPSRVRAALGQAEFVVALTAFQAPSLLAYADVILPMASFAETAGTFVNVEGRWQSFAAAVTPPGAARPAWKILRVLGNLFELSGFTYEDCNAIGKELEQEISAAKCPLPAADAYDEVVPAQDVETSALAGLASTFSRITEWPLYASDNLLRRARSLQMAMSNEGVGVYMNAQSAEQLGVTAQQIVKVQQAQGIAQLPVVVDERIPACCVWIPAGRMETAQLGESFGMVQIHVA